MEYIFEIRSMIQEHKEMQALADLMMNTLSDRLQSVEIEMGRDPHLVY